MIIFFTANQPTGPQPRRNNGTYHGTMSTAPRIAAAKRDWGHDEAGCTVLHIDMDAFYASLEIARHPEYAGKPVIIGVGNRSVVSAASYEARKYGINSAMSSAKAQQLCPNGIFLPVDMRYYRAMSGRIFEEVFERITDRIERVSVDECYMDVSSALLAWKSPKKIGEWIREQVRSRYNITCSVGIAANKLVAKMASTNAKPDGMLMIPKAKHAEFVQMMPLRGIPGIGPAQEKRLNAWGINNVADLAKTSVETLTEAAGSPIAARNLHLAAYGLDERPVTTYRAEKSIGAERTFSKDTQNMEEVCSMLRWCSNDVAATLRKRGLMARKITVKIRFPDLSYATKSHTLEQPTDTAGTLYPQCVRLLLDVMGMPETSRSAISLTRPIRLAGMNVAGLLKTNEAAIQPSLDDLLEEENAHEHANKTGRAADMRTKTEKIRGAEAVLDEVREKYGNGSVSFGV